MKCVKEKKFLFWKWTDEDHDFSYGGIRKIGSKRKCKKCGLVEILYEVYSGSFEKENWKKYEIRKYKMLTRMFFRSIIESCIPT